MTTEADQASAASDALPTAVWSCSRLGEEWSRWRCRLRRYASSLEVLEHMRRGELVRVFVDDEEITTQQAADFLKVSRPYLVGLMDRGAVRSRKVGVRRRMALSDVLLYREVDQARRLQAVAELVAEAQELGAY